MIKKIAGKYVVVGEHKTPGRAGKGGKLRRFGTYKTLAEAKKRLAQVEFFKHKGRK